jgi:hypothetical protein
MDDGSIASGGAGHTTIARGFQIFDMVFYYWAFSSSFLFFLLIRKKKKINLSFSNTGVFISFLITSFLFRRLV